MALEDFAAALERDPLDAVDRFISREFFGYRPGPDEPGATDRIRSLVADLTGAMPDLSVRLTAVEADGEVFTGTLTLTGTHQAGLWGAPGQGARLDWSSPVSVREIGDRFAIRFDDFSPPAVVEVIRGLGLVNRADEMHLPPDHPVSVPDFVLKLLLTGRAGDLPCSHLDQIRVTEPATRRCEECFAEGTIWPSLRLCLVCGAVGCCDTSTNRHAMAHFEETGHPLMRSVRMDEGWGWCYVDNAFFEKETIDRMAR
jgi:hypothetical protein